VPIGGQLIARRGREDLLLSLGAQLERLAPWPLSPMATAD
jgi:Asp-tRNA(Asn)/Glu-tRNA(Gln) amidotransferase A subunit family amidase